MKANRAYLGWGLLLVAAGIVFLLQNFDLLGPVENLVWLVLFGAAGLVFLGVFLTNREYWWAIIPGFTLLGLAGLIGLGDLLGDWGATLFLGAIGLSFWVIYAVKRDFWWAVIPGGVLLSVALIPGFSSAVGGDAAVGLFFLGMAITFALVYLLPNPNGRMKWALIPAGILGVMGLFFLAALGNLTQYVGPVVLILGGGYLVLRALMARKSS